MFDRSPISLILCNEIRGNWGKTTHGRVVVGKGVINTHVLEKPADMGVEESLNFFVVELGVDEYGTYVGFEYI